MTLIELAPQQWNGTALKLFHIFAQCENCNSLFNILIRCKNYKHIIPDTLVAMLLDDSC